MTQTVPITLIEEDFAKLRELVAQHVTTRDAGAAEQLELEIERARVVPSHEAPRDLVTMNSRVHFEDSRTGRARVVELVYPPDADASAGRVSVLAPIGAALLGLSVGQSIEWPLPNGTTALVKIVGVDHPAASPAAAAT
ncbi:MAG TPA: nucleoside diphosphate kinase regulator [Anaeromyxobacteraceae bacterium]|nr:nucleoside diphosphate kinase regulator [Anaeromyxobacteraceae bacterium]